MAKQNGSRSSSEQLAPHSVEAEEAVLGSVLISPDALYEVLPFLQAGDFFIVRHGWIYEAMLRLHQRRDPLDYLTIVSELEAVNRLSEAGGAAYLLELIRKTPSSLNSEGYGLIVKRTAIRRRLLDAAGQIARAAHSDNPEIDEILFAAEEALYAVLQNHRIDNVATLTELSGQLVDETFAAMRGEITPGIPTRIRDLDKLLVGLRPSDLIIVAGRPGMGKSSLLESIAAENAAAGIPIALFSIEQSRMQVTRRLAAAEAQIPYLRLAGGTLHQNEIPRFLDAAQRIAQWPLIIDDTPSLTPMEARTKIRRFVIEHDIKLVIIDYVQLMSGGPQFNYSENRVQEISFISRELKKIAREMELPVLLASQLSRAVEQRSDKRPLLSDLRESGSLEQDADVILFPFRESYYTKEDDNSTELILAKHRQGPTGAVRAMWLPERMRFVDAFHTNGDKQQHEQQILTDI